MASIKPPDARTPQNRADINLKPVNKHENHRRSHDPLPTDRNGGTSDPINFDNAKASAAPPGWTTTQIGRSQVKWTMEKDDSALNQPSVLKQSGEATYPVCLKNDTPLKDRFVKVKFKPIAGKEDQAGGVAWRAKDADNCYTAPAKALDDNVTIYHTINGRRISFKNGDTKVAFGVSHALRVEFIDHKFTVTLDGKHVIEGCEPGHHGEDVRSTPSSRITVSPTRLWLGGVVHAADSYPSHPSHPNPACESLRWLAFGFGALGLNEHEILARESMVYDTLYAECQRQVVPAGHH